MTPGVETELPVATCETGRGGIEERVFVEAILFRSQGGTEFDAYPLNRAVPLPTFYGRLPLY